MTMMDSKQMGSSSGAGMSGMMNMPMPAMMPGMSMPMGSTGMMSGMMGMPGMMAGMMVPQCAIQMESMAGGMKMTCTADDPMAAAMLQSLCAMMPNAMCSCGMMMNGMCCCACNMGAMGASCKVENIDNGVAISCTSGDSKVEKMCQACCDCMDEMMSAGCMCCVMMNGMPVCCGMPSK